MFVLWCNIGVGEDTRNESEDVWDEEQENETAVCPSGIQTHAVYWFQS